MLLPPLLCAVAGRGTQGRRARGGAAAPLQRKRGGRRGNGTTVHLSILGAQKHLGAWEDLPDSI